MAALVDLLARRFPADDLAHAETAASRLDRPRKSRIRYPYSIPNLLWCTITHYSARSAARAGTASGAADSDVGGARPVALLHVPHRSPGARGSKHAG